MKGLFDVPHVNVFHLAVEPARRLVVVVDRDRRSEFDTDIQTVVGGEQQGRVDGQRPRSTVRQSGWLMPESGSRSLILVVLDCGLKDCCAAEVGYRPLP